MLVYLIGESIRDSKLYDYGLVVEPDTFEFQPTGCRLHLPYTVCYALVVANQAGAKIISLIGIKMFLKVGLIYTVYNILNFFQQRTIRLQSEGA